jgi:hypothetical protein
MTRSRFAVILAVSGLFAASGNAFAQTAEAAAGTQYQLALTSIAHDGVLDEARLFSPDALATARKKIGQLRSEYHCAVLIETIARAPDSDRAQSNTWFARKADEYFHLLAYKRSEELGFEGIHVLICKQPRHVAAVVWPQRLEAQFNANDAKGIERLFRQNLMSTPDETLRDALNQIGVDLQKNRQPRSPSLPLGPLGVFIAGTIGVWLVLAAVRLGLHKPEPFALTGESHSLCLNAGLLASMFGHPSTHWITDRLFPHASTCTPADVQQAPTPEIPPSPNEEHFDAEQLVEHTEMS